MKKNFEPGVYLVTDRGLAKGRSIEFIVEEAVKGGATMVQLREKTASTAEFLELSLRLKKLLAPAGIHLIINDRMDIALAAGADGIHIGQSDMPYEIVRKFLGPDAIIGLSVENLTQAQKANDLDVDYIGLSPVFSTPTKTDTAAELGLEGVREIARVSRHTIVGIGGIHKGNAGDIIRAGAHGVGVVSAIVSADDPRAATRELRSVVMHARKNKEER